jgi:hypothetical protein
MMWYKSNAYFSTKKSGKNDSKFEAGYAQKLELEKKAGKIRDYEEQVIIPLEVNGRIVKDYKIDFVVYHHDGTTEYVETKGWFTDVFRLTWKIFLALYEDQPNVKISLVCQGKGYKPKLRKVKK